MINLPIFRAKRLNSDEYVFGVPRQDSKGMYEMIINVVEDGISGVIQRYIEIDTISIHFPDMLDSQRNKIFASLQEDGKGGDLVGYIDGHINYNVAERYVISEDGVLFLRDIIPNIKKYTLDKEIASWYKIYGIQKWSPMQYKKNF